MSLSQTACSAKLICAINQNFIKQIIKPSPDTKESFIKKKRIMSSYFSLIGQLPRLSIRQQHSTKAVFNIQTCISVIQDFHCSVNDVPKVSISQCSERDHNIFSFFVNYTVGLYCQFFNLSSVNGEGWISLLSCIIMLWII